MRWWAWLWAGVALAAGCWVTGGEVRDKIASQDLDSAETADTGT